jgi:bacillithiol biosynthesis cysteine-adding enzyme BshC
MQARYLPYADTHRFSRLVVDYLAGKSVLSKFFSYSPDAAGLAKSIEHRKKHPVRRDVLQQVLRKQYRMLPAEAAVARNIDMLGRESTFTVCTAHQPNLATGYLYFVYKILHAIRLAEELRKAHPDCHFVPVYYMGSEDADLEELGSFRFGEKKFVWDAAGQQGAVGRMNTASLQPLLDELFAIMGPPGGHEQSLKALLREAYLAHDTIAAATQFLVHSLFGKYGLVVLDADDAALKESFIPVMEADLFEHRPAQLAGDTSRQLSEAGYGAQAFPRPINLFYLEKNLRARIEEEDGCWRVHGSDISWSAGALREELHAHPERFSPNVVLRPLYQETILPDVAFIGGGSELAYWLQLKSLFIAYGVFFPAILLRQSVMWLNPRQQQRLGQTGLSYEALFLSKEEAARSWLQAQGRRNWKLDAEQLQLEQLLGRLREKAAAIDPTLDKSGAAVLARMEHLFASLETKMLRALKRKDAVALARIERLQEELFPGGGLAERRENFMPYYLEYGDAFFETLLRYMEPLRNEFLIIADESASE